jgi:hypothetical protein
MRKWTKSACVVLAWCIMPILVAVGMHNPARPAQAIHRIASSTAQVTLTAYPTEAAKSASTAGYVVQPGDTLSGIAAALAVRGGWQALYAANRQPIGPDPNIIRVGIVLALPGRPMPPKLVTKSRQPRHFASPARPVARPHHHAAAATHSASFVRVLGMPRWLKAMLLTVGIVIGLALFTEPLAALARRRARGRHRRLALATASIVMADHERLIVTYSRQDDTVYVLTPPGEDPRAVLRAARLVLSEDKYQELAGQLGVSANWPME